LFQANEADDAYLQHMGPYKMAQTVTLLICILELPGSNLGRGSDYSEVFRSFLQPLQMNAGQNLQFGHDGLLPHPFQLITIQSINAT
jgi:hypothetical protein